MGWFWCIKLNFPRLSQSTEVEDVEAEENSWKDWKAWKEAWKEGEGQSGWGRKAEEGHKGRNPHSPALFSWLGPCLPCYVRFQGGKSIQTEVSLSLLKRHNNSNPKPTVMYCHKHWMRICTCVSSHICMSGSSRTMGWQWISNNTRIFTEIQLTCRYFMIFHIWQDEKEVWIGQSPLHRCIVRKAKASEAKDKGDKGDKGKTTKEIEARMLGDVGRQVANGCEWQRSDMERQSIDKAWQHATTCCKWLQRLMKWWFSGGILKTHMELPLHHTKHKAWEHMASIVLKSG